MTQALKYIAVILVAAVVLVIILKLGSCGGGVTAPRSLDVPQDSNFVPVTRSEYHVPIFPGKGGLVGPKLPSGMSEDEVRRIITISVRDLPGVTVKKIDVIESVGGSIFVAKDSMVAEVEVVDVKPSYLRFGLNAGIGITIGKKGDEIRYSPAAMFSPIEWNGWLQLPLFLADFDGVGAGFQAKIYHDIYAGAAHLWRYDTGRQAKIILSYVF